MTAELDIAAWCARTAEHHRDMEEHELALYPSPDDRDTAIVEWTVRVLGNPALPESAAVVAALAAQHRAAGEIADLTRERDEARARADRLAETLREILDQIRVPESLVGSPGPYDYIVRWRSVLAEQPTPTTDPIAALGPEITARRAVAGELDRLAADDKLTAVWLERHGLGGQLAPSPPRILAALTLDIAAGEVHGRRERWEVADLVGGYVCAEPDPDMPDGICGMPVEDVPCTVHHPADGATR